MVATVGLDKLLFVFDGGVLTREDLAKVTLQTNELEQLRFFSPASFAEVLTDRLSRRIAAAVHAVNVGDTTYLEPLTQPTNV
jgi:hypothetical protein